MVAVVVMDVRKTKSKVMEVGAALNRFLPNLNCKCKAVKTIIKCFR